MLIKFETKSARVKGLAFHPTKGWLLASLHNGIIQLWDYDVKTMIDKFEGHQGPVRGLDFHKHQPLFVSGGDDKKIIVWDYKKRRSLFTLDAHEDYVRSTFFHHENPWILSSSDDQSIRIWNWQSRTRLAVLTGHTHYIMCAQFHPASELILSASIDQTLRLWDISGLRAKSSNSREDASGGLPELLTKTDYSVESKEGHNSEINWCAFHPDSSKQLCLSAGDDNYIKVWKIDSRYGLREVDTLRGHYNNVSCATFHPRKDMILSTSEDRSIKVWDLEKRVSIYTHRREVDRFWVIAAHPRENLFAAGHDTGVMLFKIEKERPCFTVFKDTILFIKGKQLCQYNIKSHEKRLLITLKPKVELTHHYHRIHCYNFEDEQTSTNLVLVSVRSNIIERSIYDLYRLTQSSFGEGPEPIRNPGLTAVFVGPNRYAVLDKARQVTFKLNDKTIRNMTPLTADEIFEASTGKLLIKSKVNDAMHVSLWDVKKSIQINAIKIDAKNVIMSEDESYIACICSDKIAICDGQLNLLTTITESSKIKSAAWSDGGLLIYSTPTQIKYSLADGDTTVLRSVPGTHYIMTVKNDQIYCMDRNCEIKRIPIDAREFQFKQAVLKNDRSAILTALRQMKTLTSAEISFLVDKGYPSLALKFVNDHETRFSLALQAHDINTALDSANELKDKKCWEQLAEAAKEVGHLQARERAYQELKDPFKLAMLYLVAGCRDKMLEARTMARDLGQSSTEYIISLLLKDFHECTQIIRRQGRPTLAYTCAVKHGLYDLAAEIRKELDQAELSNTKLPPLEDALKASHWMHETIPDIGNSKDLKNWPILRDEQDDLEVGFSVQPQDNKADYDDNEMWGDDADDTEEEIKEEIEEEAKSESTESELEDLEDW